MLVTPLLASQASLAASLIFLVQGPEVHLLGSPLPGPPGRQPSYALVWSAAYERFTLRGALSAVGQNFNLLLFSVCAF
jgi:hypothetical protein